MFKYFIYECLISFLFFVGFTLIQKRRLGAAVYIVSNKNQKGAIFAQAMQVATLSLFIVVTFLKIKDLDILGIVVVFLVGIYYAKNLSNFLNYFIGIGIYQNGLIASNGIVLNDKIDYTFTTKVENKELYYVGSVVHFIFQIKMRYVFYADKEEVLSLTKKGKMFSKKVKL